MRDNGVNLQRGSDFRKLISVKDWCFRWPIIRWGKYVGGWLMKSVSLYLFGYSILPVGRYCTADTKDIMPTCLNDCIIRNSFESLMVELLTVKVGRIVMISSDKDNPVVSLTHTLGVAPSIYQILIVALPFKTETTIASNNQQCVSHPVLDTHLMHEDIEVSVDIAADNDALGLWEFEQIHNAVYSSSDLILAILAGRLKSSISRLEMPKRVVSRWRTDIEARTWFMISVALAFVSM